MRESSRKEKRLLIQYFPLKIMVHIPYAENPGVLKGRLEKKEQKKKKRHGISCRNMLFRGKKKYKLIYPAANMSL